VSWALADLFEAVVDAVPDREAVACGGRRLSYRQLDERANRLSHALARRGVRAGQHVGLWLHNETEYLEAMLAAFKLRAVPINVNWRYVDGELVHLLGDADVVAVVHEQQFGDRLEGVRAQLPALGFGLARGDEYETALAAESPGRDFGSRSSDDLYVIYTGGTTGAPKGVMWRHEDLLFGALEGVLTAEPLATPGDIAARARAGAWARCLPASPFMHGTAHWMALVTLFHGGTVVVGPDTGLAPERLWQLVADETVSFFVIVGDAFARPLVDALERHPGRWDLSCVRYLLSAGAILSPPVKEALVRHLPGAQVIDGFGASETGSQGAMVGAGDGSSPHPRFRLNSDTLVVDEDMRPVASGTVGRLARRGHVPLGYYNDPERTAITFPVVDGVRWAVPGDMAVPEGDGTVSLLGRGSVCVNTGGEKVYAEEVEATLKSHPAVYDAVVVGVPDETWGERVAVVVQPRPGPVPSLEDLADHCRHRLAGYKVPRHLVVVDAVRRAPSGKPDYVWARRVAAGTGREAAAR
jgi:acyl-CoA synthetase (AMP-forming)/AMP-acid ligase II